MHIACKVVRLIARPKESESTTFPPQAEDSEPLAEAEPPQDPTRHVGSLWAYLQTAPLLPW
jgi:hypothetical protein